MYRLLPASYRRKLAELLMLGGSKRAPQGFLKAALFLSALLGAGAGILAGPLAGLAAFAGAFGLFHGLLLLAIDRRTKFVESILPDALQLVAANSRAGYIPSRALLLSARKEFGPLSEAIKHAGKDMLTGESVEEALRKIPRFIRSEQLAKTIDLIIEGNRSGGHFASLLEENAEDIRRSQVLHKEVRASVVMYVIFISFAGVLAAPVLYALSGFLIGTIGAIGSSASIPEEVFSQVKFIRFGTVNLDPGFLYFFSLAAIVITTVFGGLLIGLISSGSERAGIKYVPLFTLVALAVFFLASGFISSLFGVFVPAAP